MMLSFLTLVFSFLNLSGWSSSIEKFARDNIISHSNTLLNYRQNLAQGTRIALFWTKEVTPEMKNSVPQVEKVVRQHLRSIF